MSDALDRARRFAATLPTGPLTPGLSYSAETSAWALLSIAESLAALIAERDEGRNISQGPPTYRSTCADCANPIRQVADGAWHHMPPLDPLYDHVARPAEGTAR